VAYLVAAKFIYANLKSLVIHDSLCQHLSSHAKDDYPQQQQKPPYIPTIQTATLSSPPSPPPTTTMPSPSETHDDQFDTRTSVTKDATHFLEQVGNVFTGEQSMNPTQLCSMEMEFLHFIDFQLCIGPSNPLHLWSWFYTTLDDYCRQYHTTVGIGSNYVGSANNNSNNKAATAS
jgi:hypothetical protein